MGRCLGRLWSWRDGGKRVRPTLCLLVGNMLGGEEARLITLGAALEMLHTATLVHDDLIDGALLRRGLPTLNARWAPPATVLTGDFLFARAAKLAAEADHLALMKHFSETLAIIVNGELAQMFGSRGVLNRDNYYKRIYAKTASLFEMTTRAAAMVSPVEENIVEEMRDFGYQLGMAFQVVDDILDFVGSERELGKPVGSDLRQGTITLPAIYYLQDHPEDAGLADDRLFDFFNDPGRLLGDLMNVDIIGFFCGHDRSPRAGPGRKGPSAGERHHGLYHAGYRRARHQRLCRRPYAKRRGHRRHARLP